MPHAPVAGIGEKNFGQGKKKAELGKTNLGTERKMLK
jgi:hypothetical protein